MNEYKISFALTLPNGESTNAESCVIERSEAAAKAVVKQNAKAAGNTVEINEVELIRDDACATKEQEKATLERIKAMVAELGPQSYIATAFDGCFEIAESNIDNDFGESMKGRAELAEKKLKEKIDALTMAENEIGEMSEVETRHTAMIADLEARVKAAEAKVMDAWLYKTIWTHYYDEVEEAKARMEELAAEMADHAEKPDSPAFKNAVAFYRKRKEQREIAEQVVRALELIEPAGL